MFPFFADLVAIDPPICWPNPMFVAETLMFVGRIPVRAVQTTIFVDELPTLMDETAIFSVKSPHVQRLNHDFGG